MTACAAKTPPTVVITGPTAVGKSRLVVDIARSLSVPILSLDAMKVYRGMDIGTAKPRPEELGEVRCHLMDLRDPWESFSVGDYSNELDAIATRLSSPWLFSGGTAFYLNAMLHGIFAGPPADSKLRAALAEEARVESGGSLHRRLVELDPEAAAKIHPADQKRVIRALEVITLTGERFSIQQARRTPRFVPERTRLFGITRPRPELYHRIDARVERMFQAGWVEEVEGLLARHDPPWGKEASQSIGYEIIREALARGEDPVAEIPCIQTRTRQFARSQRTWFRKMAIEWWSPSEAPLLIERIRECLAGHSRGDGMGEIDPARRSMA